MSDSRRFTSVLVLIVFAPLALDGCVSVGISRSALPPPEPETATLEVRIYETAGEHRQDLVSRRNIVSELFFASRLLYTETEPVWLLTNLSPGDYRLVVNRWIDESGQIHALAGVSQRILLRGGEKVTAAIVLKNLTVGTILLAAAVTAGVVIVLVIALGDAICRIGLCSDMQDIPSPAGAAPGDQPLRPMPSNASRFTEPAVAPNLP